MGLRNRKRINLKSLALGGIVAAAAGYVAGLLTAPKSGKQTRDDLKQTADKGLAEAEKDLKILHVQLEKAIGQAKTNQSKLSTKAQSQLKDALAGAKDAKEKAGEVLSAVRQGSAKDKDLEKAVKDAKASLKHLRDYLKK
jgi:gas vesicle protein